jgi:hypothetical protein
MKIDRFTKVVLLAIGVFLGIIALNPWFQPNSVYATQQPNLGVEILGQAAIQRNMFVSVTFIDTRNGDMWTYVGRDEDWNITYVGTFTEPGKPFVFKEELMKK